MGIFLDPLLWLFFLGLFFAINSKAKLKWLYFIFFILIFSPLSEYCLIRLEQTYQAPKNLDPQVRAAVVLGGDLIQFYKQTNQFNYARAYDRTGEALRFLKKNELDLVIFTGESTIHNENVLGETESFVELAKEFGVDPTKIIIESKARNTFQNAENIQNEIKKLNVERFYLITSASHIPRSIKVFNKLGMNPIPFPVGQGSGELNFSFRSIGLKQFIALATVLHETVGMVYYKIRGYI